MPEPKDDLASALRRAADLLIERHLDDDELRKATELVNLATDVLESGPVVSLEERSERFVRQMAAHETSGAIHDGALFVAFDESPYSGSANAHSPTYVNYRRVGETVHATAVLGTALEGRPGRAHGGVIAALFDDTMGAVQLVIGRNGYTRTLHTSYLAPFPTDQEVSVVAHCSEYDGSRFTVEATATVEGQAVATAVGVFTEITRARWTRR